MVYRPYLHANEKRIKNKEKRRDVLNTLNALYWRESFLGTQTRFLGLLEEAGEQRSLKGCIFLYALFCKGENELSTLGLSNLK